MVLLLVRATAGNKPTSPQKGDVIEVRDEDAPMGRRESMTVWLAEGRDAADFPPELVLISMDGLAKADAAFLTEGDVVENGRRREYTLDFDSLERRSPTGGRDTLRTHKTITRKWAEVSDLAARKP